MSTVALGDLATFVVGVDASTEMLRAARRAPNCEYLLAHAEALPFPDSSFDAATCCSGVHWFDQGRFFDELAAGAATRADGSASTTTTSWVR